MQKLQSTNLVDADNGISDVVQSDLAVPINIQDVKGLLGLLRLQEMLQILSQNVCPAQKTTLHLSSCCPSICCDRVDCAHLSTCNAGRTV